MREADAKVHGSLVSVADIGSAKCAKAGELVRIGLSNTFACGYEREKPVSGKAGLHETWHAL